MPSLRSILSFPQVYRVFWKVIGGPKYIKIFMDEYVRPERGDRILDIGCGPGNTVPYFLDHEYVGFDMSPEYIEAARRRFPQATFVCDRISRYTLPQHEYFDLVLALGVVHHLDDGEAQKLFEIAYRALKPGGKLVTFDGVIAKDQSPLARYLLRRDRGGFVRDRDVYVQIASRAFVNVQSTVRHDLLRIPYSHIIMTCMR